MDFFKHLILLYCICMFCVVEDRILSFSIPSYLLILC